jgi:putative phage-type endonuclease
VVDAQELIKRRDGIGGSDAAAALGLSKYKSPFQLYLEKIGEIDEPEQEKPVLARGKRFEPVLRQMYTEQTGREVNQFFKPIQSAVIPFMFVTPDGIADEDRYLEIKTARHRSEWGEPGTDEIPQEYLIQVQHGLFVTGLQVADVFVAFSLDDIELYEVRADKELQDLIIEGEREFWNHVKTLNPPEITNYEDVIARYRRSSRKAIEASLEIERLANLLKRQKERIKLEEDEEKKIKAELMKFMGEHDTLLDHKGKPLITWKQTKERQEFDEAKFKAAHPELWGEFLKPKKPQRRFLVK